MCQFVSQIFYERKSVFFISEMSFRRSFYRRVYLEATPNSIADRFDCFHVPVATPTFFNFPVRDGPALQNMLTSLKNTLQSMLVI